MQQQTKLYIQNYGCQMNERDAEHMRDLMVQDNQMSVTFIPEEADMVILNTCSIREKAQEKVFSETGSLENSQREKASVNHCCRWLRCQSRRRRNY